ncbi:DUF1990 family protein [Nocardia callitridis]|uniref:DUF1990 domain-containing protein n=1 Tax=Nocardia callitridis TaxID=648753 RepID=A0ABP9KH79_9NOCA
MQHVEDDPPFTYPEVGATKGPLPEGYHRFRLRRRLGYGKELFEHAAAELLSYRMQKGAGVFHSADTPSAEPGTHLSVRLGPKTVGIVAPCRVVYVLCDPLPSPRDTTPNTLPRRGFAYGTLPGHPESGEELFAVEYDPTDDAVYGLVIAFSRNAAWYARLGGPLVKMIQRYVAGKYLDALPTTG